MKIAEALQERADLNKKISYLKQSLEQNALHQDGELPAEDPNDTLEELNSVIDRLEKLMSAINLTNSKTVVDGKTITEWIAKRDSLRIKSNAYDKLIYAASDVTDRASGREIKIFSSVDVKSLRKIHDSIAKEIRTVDNLIQKTNWEADLL